MAWRMYIHTHHRRYMTYLLEGIIQSYNPRTAGGRLSAPLRFFADSEKKTAARNFCIALINGRQILHSCSYNTLTHSLQFLAFWPQRSRLQLTLTRAPLGYFYNAPHWGAISSPPSDLRNYWADSKNSSGIWKPWKNCRRKTNFIDLRVTSDVTGQVKVKMFDISTSASKIAMLSTNKAN